MFMFPDFCDLCILPLAVLYVCQAEGQLIPIMKQTCMIKIPENPAVLAWLFTQILENSGGASCNGLFAIT